MIVYIVHMIRMIRSGGQAGRLIITQLQWAQQVSGLSRPLLEDSTYPIPHLKEEISITSVREFLSASDLSFEIAQIRTKDKLRENDKFIMELAVSNEFTNQEVIYINICRIYLQVTTLAQICSMDGKRIKENAFKCKITARALTRERWPDQNEPKGIVLQTWKRFLRTITEAMTLKLLEPLGEWYLAARQDLLHLQTDHFYSPTEKVCYRFMDNKWEKGMGNNSRRGFKVNSWVPTEMYKEKAKSFIPAEVISETAIYDIIVWSNIKQVARSTTVTNNMWEEYIAKENSWRRLVLFNVVVDYNELNQIYEGTNSTIYATSTVISLDGCYKYGWMLFSGGMKPLAFGYGNTNQPTSKSRAEAIGQLGWCCFINFYAKLVKKNLQARIICYTKNKSMAEKMDFHYDTHKISNTMIEEYDVIQQIHHELKQISYQGTRFDKPKIIANKDEDKEGVTKSTLGKVEEEIRKANVKIKHIGDEISIPTCKCRLLQNGKQITKQEKERLLWNWCNNKMRIYLSKKFQVEQEVIDTINWNDLYRTRKMMTPGLHIYSVKCSIDWLAIGTKMDQIGYNVTKCIHCNKEEDFNHMMKCQGKQESSQSLLERFESKLIEINTEYFLRKYIMVHLKRWFEVYPSKRKAKKIPRDKAIQQQNVIGWDKFIKGMIANAIVDKQMYYIQERNIKQKDWTKQVILWWTQESNKIWCERNEKIHSKGISSQHTREEEEALLQVKDLYDKQFKVTMQDREIFDMNIQERIKGTAKAMTTWAKKFTSSSNGKRNGTDKANIKK